MAKASIHSYKREKTLAVATLREIILNELEIRQWSIGRLAQSMKRRGMSRNTVYRWLSGRGNITDKNFDLILKEMKLFIRLI
jgi:hypothetical protein